MVTDKKERTARDMVIGENYKTTAETYEEYYNEQVEKHGEDKIKSESLKVQNKSYGQKQFETYSNTLKDNPYMPKNIEDFIDLKYHHNEWNILKRSYYEENNNRYCKRN